MGKKRIRKKLDHILVFLRNYHKYRIRALEFLRFNAKYRCFIDIIVVLVAVGVQCISKVWIIYLLGNKMIDYLRDSSLMLSMASTIGLSTVVVFGFNLGKSVQQFWKGTIREHGLENLIETIVPETHINYWQLILLVILYACIVAKMYAIFYILLIYDVLLYLVLLLQWWLLETAGYEYIENCYREMSEKEKIDFLSKILQGSVEKSEQVNMRALETYVKLLYIYIDEEESAENTVLGDNGNDAEKQMDTIIKIEEFYDKAKELFYDTLRNLVLDRKSQTFLVLSLIQKFCDIKKMQIEGQKTQILLSIMIKYALDREENLDIDLIYKGLTSWSDKSLSLRYCISIARMEFLYSTNHNANRIYWSNSIFSLYFPVKKDSTYWELISVIWYLWCREEEISYLLWVKYLDNLIKMFENNFGRYYVIESKDSLFLLIKGLRY